MSQKASELLNYRSAANERKGKRLHIAFFSDFCYPRKGGVENHQWALAQELIRRGHKVIAITNTYYDKQKGTRQGVRWMKNGLKIYYTPIQPIFDQNSLPILFFFIPLMRNIFIRERIELVHYHAASSFMSISCCIGIAAMGLHSVYTDHSLFPFNDTMYIHINKGLKCSLTETDQVIAVSHICKENLTLRACLNPHIVNVIPNAVDSTKFRPPSVEELKANQMHRNKYFNTINVVMITRMVFRKGIHLAVKVIPTICAKHKNVKFIIGGDGPSQVLLHKMLDKYPYVRGRVELLGAVPHIGVRDVLIRGHIFLNCSLTESFCIAILEAACCGLYVVATNVGGVPEVLPSYMCSLCELDSDDIAAKMSDAIQHKLRKINIDTRYEWYSFLRNAYCWQSVAERTEKVYYRALGMEKDKSILNRMKKYYDIGPLLGKVMVFLVLIDWLLLKFWEWYFPQNGVQKAIDFPNIYDRDADDTT
eukprot:25453_1